MISLTAIREHGHNVRRVAAGRHADEALEESIRSQGVLVPILVRPETDGTYTVIAGHRRVAAARAVGLTEIPALVLASLVNGHATAAQAAENMVRAPMHPVDQWRAIVQLQEDGFSLPAAAASLGLTERFARRLDKLGHLHPEVLQLIERHGLPADSCLSAIAMAKPEQQRKAVKAKGVVQETHVESYLVAQACRTQRFSRSDAIFDITSVRVAWDEDLFAEPGSPEQYTTTDGKAFLAAQQAALEAQVAERAANKHRVRLTTFSERTGIALPAGWRIVWREGRPRTNEAIFCAVKPDGSICYQLAEDGKARAEREKKAAAREREKEKAARAAAKAGAPAESAPAAEDDPDDDDDTGTVEAAAPKSPITKAGIEFIARAKTQALRDHLRGEETATRSHEEMLRLMILLLGCSNISIMSDGIPWQARRFEDLAARLLWPGGQLDPHTGPTLAGIAGEMIARIVSFDTNRCGSGAAAEWIGAAIGADDALPRFDTPEFLAHVTGEELRRAATEAGIKPLTKISALREQLVGQLPAWKPAAFGAPAPVITREDDEP